MLLNKCKELNENDLKKDLGFGFQNIKESLVHVAGCYHAWLGSFVLSETTSPLLTKETINNMQIVEYPHLDLSNIIWKTNFLRPKNNLS
ncbi:DinB family protein [Priestia filamentosa]